MACLIFWWTCVPDDAPLLHCQPSDAVAAPACYSAAAAHCFATAPAS
uniref:Uncharacterized protein n=1 Tax=Aegilops tauschii subsp. strangulata TaxID=200361 RepID=A0A453D3I4_AEGTS